MLSQHQFFVLRALKERGDSTQRSIASATGLSLGAVNKALRSLRDAELIDETDSVTIKGHSALKPHRVQGAVILAAGMSTRLAPLSYEHPKALFRVQGEVLIERLIRQLQEANVPRITIVVGHMKEQFFYLEDKFKVELIEASDYSSRNNHASVLAAGSRIQGAYICSSDQYLPNNPFHEWEYASESMVVELQPHQTDTPIIINSRNVICGQPTRNDMTTWSLLGPAFLTAKDGGHLIEIINEEYSLPETKDKLWENILLAHLSEFELYAIKTPRNAIQEFDRMEDLCSFDSDFLSNVDSSILDNICKTLNCSRTDILNVEPLTTGLTNLSVLFSCKGERFVYRFPGAGTGELVNRKAEAYALEKARELGLDTTYIFEDPESGWKLSRFLPNCTPFDYENHDHVSTALTMVKTLHASDATSPWRFDFYEEAQRISALLLAEGVQLPADFQQLQDMMSSIAAPMRNGAGTPVLCHNDFYGPNILISDDSSCLIDWEYAAMGDYGCDLGNFIAQGSGYSVDEALSILPMYFGREATDEEKNHVIMCTAIVGWYWYVWALYKEHSGSGTGKWLRIWYNAAKEFGARALSLLTPHLSRDRALSETEFSVLVALAENPSEEIDDLETLAKLQTSGLASGRTITSAGIAALEPYRAKRAIFFAAGFGSRMLPITINTPKPLVRVWGTRIIDRLLDAITNIGIEEIYVVRGYLKEEFDQLLAKYPTIRFIDNPIFDSTNNISSAVLAKDAFENAYAFESDLFLSDPTLIKKYQYSSNYLAIPVENTTDWCFTVNDSGIITDITKGLDSPCWQMVGVSYWTKEDGKKLATDIPEVFGQSETTRQIFWDDVALKHRAENYRISVRECDPAAVLEIDTFQELQQIDSAYKV